MAIRVAIVEDHSGYRETLVQMFRKSPDFQVSAACPNAETALNRIPKMGCDIVLMDVNLPRQSGIECLRALKAQMPGVRVVMLTAYDDNDILFHSLIAGADGYLLKRVGRARLLEALRDIVSGGAPISPQIARRMVEYFHKLKDLNSSSSPPTIASDPDVKSEELSPQQLAVLSGLAEGLMYKEIADQLGVSIHTVRNYIRRVYEKLHVHTRTQAVLKFLSKKT